MTARPWPTVTDELEPESGLRRRPVIYRMFSDQNGLLYIGSTVDVAEHARQQPWWDQVHVVRLETWSDEGAMRRAEQAAVRSERPTYNRVWNEAMNPRSRRAHTAVRLAPDEHAQIALLADDETEGNVSAMLRKLVGEGLELRYQSTA